MLEELSSTRTAAPQPAAMAPPRVRVLFAISDEERKTFFPSACLEELPGIAAYGYDARAGGGSGWDTALREVRPEILVSCWSTPRLPDDLAASPEPLKFVCHVAGTIKHLVPRRFLERGGVAVNWGGTIAPMVAEHALLLALAALRNLAGWPGVAAELKRNPAQSPVKLSGTRTLTGKRVGIHGCGGVARGLVEFLKPFGVEIRCHSRHAPPAVIAGIGAAPEPSLEELFARSDVLFECEALTAQSCGSVSAAILARLPDGAVFVNVARGRIVDEAALLAEAVSGRIRVALDVYAHEPRFLASPFHGVPGVILSPHIGGPTLDRFPSCGELALENLGRYLRGEPLREEVTLEIYDRST